MLIRPPAVGYGNLLKGSVLIVMRNLHRLLHIAALCFLLPYLLTASYRAITTENVVDVNLILSEVFLTYVLALTKKAQNELLNPDP